ncbi:MAG: CBS domain-containing protein, partial [Anaerolineae bacterium]|nr:CBS domain-containing protein [Anaerolineae bacterium]
TDVKRGEATAGELMSKRVVTAPSQMTVVDAISLLLHEGRKRLIVVNDEGQAVGLIDRQTLLAASISL